jgi:ribosomal protein L11 methyltransferase
MKQGWSALELELPGRLEESALGLLGLACLGVEVHPAGGDSLRLVAFFDLPAEARSASRRLECLLRGADRTGVRTRVRIAPVADGRWAERYQAGLSPFPVGQRFLVDPSNRGGAPRGRRVIALLPGGAFGTGEHATTRLCVEALERHVTAGSRWLDVGCGSGILTVVACFCGASEVLALDVDPEAVRVARQVVERNGVASAVHVVRGSQESALPHAWDGLVANIAAPFFLEGAGAAAERLVEGGRLIAAGFATGERTEIEEALHGAGLSSLEAAQREGWGVLVLRRTGARERGGR